MKEFTRNTILQAFEQLLKEMPFEKIMVSLLVRRCGIHHNTFYYHFRDIYQLLYAWLAQALGRFLPGEASCPWEESVKALLLACQQQKRLLMHLRHSPAQEQLEQFIFSAADAVFSRLIAQEAAGSNVPEETLQDAAALCRYAFSGYFLKWLGEQMEGDIAESAARMSRVFHIFISRALSDRAEAAQAAASEQIGTSV